jgi:hypothetical protein
MTEYENWNGSRWEFTKTQSNWHFDTKRPAELGKDSYTPVCIFDADFTDAIEACMPRAKTSTWATRNPKVDTLYSANAEQQDLIRAGADPDVEVFARAHAEDIPLFQKINEYLGLEESTIKFHNQTTGQMLHLHVDNFAGRPERENSFKVTEMDKNPDVMRRFAVMLADWQMGQAWMFGNALYHQWEAGTCITWDWRNMPHATVNAGWHPRPLLQITGKQTKLTKDIVRVAESNIGQPLNKIKI